MGLRQKFRGQPIGSELLEPKVVLGGSRGARHFEPSLKGAPRRLTTTFSWEPPSLDLVRAAAARLGMPFQVYVKSAAVRQACADLTSSDEAIAAMRERAGASRCAGAS